MARGRVVRRSTGFSRRSPGRLTEWLRSAVATDSVALSANSVILDSSLTTAEKAKRPFTITRLVGSLWVQSDQAVAVEVPFGAWGLIVVMETAVTAGVASLPLPYSQAENDGWFAHQFFAAEGAASTNVGQHLERFEFDFRSQRKVEEGMDIAVVVQNGSATDDMRYVSSFRMLIKLS